MSLKSEVIKNDKRLLDCAIYRYSEGQKRVVSMQDPGQLDEIQEEFNYLKDLVQRGSYTMNELEDKIYGEFGIAERSESRVVGFGPTEIEDLDREVFEESE